MDRLGTTTTCRLPNSNLMLPPGFRFHPSDEELIVHYLRNKATSRPIPASIIAEIDLYKFNPWDLPAKASFGENEWYFFSPRDRKYPNGVRPNRAAASGYWKATGTDKPILTSCRSQSVGVKKALVFYKGRPPKGIKTDWIMHEYRLLDTMPQPARSRGSMRLDDWVLCRVKQKSNLVRTVGEEQDDSSAEAFGAFLKVDGPTMNDSSNNLDSIANYLQKDCPLMAFILASQDSSFDSNSNISFQVSNDSSNTNSVIQPYLDQGNLALMVNSTENIPSPLKRTTLEEHQEYEGLPSTKRLNNNMNSDFFNFCVQYQPPDTIFSQHLSNPINGFQPPNRLQVSENSL